MKGYCPGTLLLKYMSTTSDFDSKKLHSESDDISLLLVVCLVIFFSFKGLIPV